VLTKILLTLGVIVVALVVVPRLLGGRKRSRPLPPARVEELIPCPRCGTYRGQYERCDCDTPPKGGK
jgi:hypothetical protein